MENSPIKNLIWIDLEMTGLSPNNDKILEIATVVTDNELNIIKKGPDLAIFQEEEVINSMNSWSEKQHYESGLTEKARNSKIDTAMAEQQTIAFLSEHVNKGTSPMCGNSVHQDRMFLRRYMPKLEGYFHYRNFDVSSFKIVATLWNQVIADSISKSEQHTAMADILESIEEMRVYKDNFLRLSC